MTELRLAGKKTIVAASRADPRVGEAGTGGLLSPATLAASALVSAELSSAVPDKPDGR
jgi:hypothetical protein